MDFVVPPRGFLLRARARGICCCGARGLVGGNLRFDTSAAPRRGALNAACGAAAQRVVRASLKGA